ncbi:unnamed protein product [Effrenium voratum]|uniref:A to I editase domain-containing protein n=1 Tax=Effrenium voratum TaxID=2562239 RepID=A0AA36J158_9DINO|nr:unnamed protein product [Effrenium voratum]
MATIKAKVRKEIDLDISAVFADKEGNSLGACWHNNLEMWGFQHSGDRDSDEDINVDLMQVPLKVHQVYIIVDLVAPNYKEVSFKDITYASCMASDQNCKTLASFTLESEKDDCNNLPGLILCKLVRNSSKRWELEAVGTFVPGPSWKEACPMILQMNTSAKQQTEAQTLTAAAAEAATRRRSRLEYRGSLPAVAQGGAALFAEPGDAEQGSPGALAEPEVGSPITRTMSSRQDSEPPSMATMSMTMESGVPVPKDMAARRRQRPKTNGMMASWEEAPAHKSGEFPDSVHVIPPEVADESDPMRCRNGLRLGLSNLLNAYPQHLCACSSGVGTKFMPTAAALADPRRERVRDSHAEVLARRGFMRYLYREAHALATKTGSAPARLLQAGDTKLEMQQNLALHLYVSTAPCGWASCRQAEASHFLAKGSGDKEAPAGCVGVSSSCLGEDGVPLSCSDKVARWQLQGLQGLLLSSEVPAPLRLSTVIIGRKFDHASCMSAFGWSHAPAILHADFSLEATLKSVRASLGILTEESPKGDGDESFVWSSGDVRAAAHDGRTGAALDSRGVSLHAAPTVAGASLLTLFNGLRKERGQEASGYAEAKRLAARELKTTPERCAGFEWEALGGPACCRDLAHCSSFSCDPGYGLRNQYCESSGYCAEQQADKAVCQGLVYASSAADVHRCSEEGVRCGPWQDTKLAVSRIREVEIGDMIVDSLGILMLAVAGVFRFSNWNRYLFLASLANFMADMWLEAILVGVSAEAIEAVGTVRGSFCFSYGDGIASLIKLEELMDSIVTFAWTNIGLAIAGAVLEVVDTSCQALASEGLSMTAMFLVIFVSLSELGVGVASFIQNTQKLVEEIEFMEAVSLGLETFEDGHACFVRNVDLASAAVLGVEWTSHFWIVFPVWIVLPVCLVTFVYTLVICLACCCS